MVEWLKQLIWAFYVAMFLMNCEVYSVQFSLWFKYYSINPLVYLSVYSCIYFSMILFDNRETKLLQNYVWKLELPWNFNIFITLILLNETHLDLSGISQEWSVDNIFVDCFLENNDESGRLVIRTLNQYFLCLFIYVLYT